jgi:hypothetical protein
MAEADCTTAVVPLQTALNVTALANGFGVARTTIQRRLKKCRVPPTEVRDAARGHTRRSTTKSTPAKARFREGFLYSRQDG